MKSADRWRESRRWLPGPRRAGSAPRVGCLDFAPGHVVEPPIDQTRDHGAGRNDSRPHKGAAIEVNGGIGDFVVGDFFRFFAVPVVMWTITSFVRTYVAPPKAPTFQRLTENQPPDSASDAAPAARAPAPAVQQAQAPAPASQMADMGAAADAAAVRTPLLAIRKPAAGDQPQAADANAAAAAPQIATAALPPAIQPALAAPVQPMAGPAPAAPAAPGPPMAAMPPSGATQDFAAKASGGAGIGSRLCLAQSKYQCAARPRHG